MAGTGEDDIVNVYGKPRVRPHAGPAAHGSHGDPMKQGMKSQGHGGTDELWIYSYADLITNLLLFFIMMFAISSIDKDKFKALSDALNSDKSVQEKAKKKAQIEVSEEALREKFEGKGGVERNIQIVQLMQMLMKNVDLASLDAQKKAKQDFETLRRKLEKLASEVKPEERRGLTFDVTFPTEQFFEKESDTPTPDARTYLGALAKELRDHGELLALSVEGHTDGTEGGTAAGRWALSSRRAASVLDVLKGAGVRTRLMSLAGYADTRPVVPETTASGGAVKRAQALNRRVVVRITKPETPDGGAAEGAD